LKGSLSHTPALSREREREEDPDLPESRGHQII
jgi:hypothetical protein